ncbi:hypothetical protein M8997_018130 [Phyllobacterium sp. 21LDTY02-6]|jgi:hypothetical protein|uniref:hypothetical protein n=1 Tax=unclassified Phyllobacterium TaxID=2638441 RepID=UPI002021B729|nr:MULTISPECIES: hypothetical protein [unclassified Phyllobacterium]MCO4319110.1 hypothetical protein [Phyllobacterium sp. 21LDTY02-6]MCX8279004.1 hypothetical protein [Phyllobacterium sp. 0TCS1.6C]MCX8293788.1 hypothetical protein [Phyllobacterium sp. 0TCS1.6A]
MADGKDKWIQRLKAEIPAYEAYAEALETGREKAGSVKCDGTPIDNSKQWAAHYRRVVDDYKALIARYEAR